jgi:aldehyde:ferredoxin oxidoreductase
VADLTKGTLEPKELDPEITEAYLGGRGLATRLFYDVVDPGCDPLGEDNVVVLATSPVVGTSAPTSCRGHMVFKSPLTNVIGSTNCGGSWAYHLKCTGYDVLVIKGKAFEPVMIDITSKGAEILPAKHLWGRNIHETTEALLEGSEVGKKARVLCIGPAGEKLVRISAVMNDKNRAYGRCGPGAVFGAKNLKAIRVQGSEKILIKDEEQYKAGLDQARYLLKAAPVTKRLLKELGTCGLLKLINVIDMLPHINFQDNVHDEADLDLISGEAIRDNILERAGACYRCPIACQRHTRVGERRGEGPEYENTVMMGPSCGIYDLESITLANYVANEYGIDTISLGGTVACAMELFERG